MSTGIVELKQISKSYENKTVLKDLELTINPGSMHGILGLSGSGKTTLLSILAGLLPPDSGEILFDGSSMKEIPADRIRVDYIGMIFQKFQLLEHMNALDNVMAAAWFGSTDRRTIRTKAIQHLEELGMADHLFKFPYQLSGGQKQRVGIARALINDPAIIIADEPSGSLDKRNSDDIMNILREVSQRGKAVVLTTHDISVVSYSDDISILREGKLITVNHDQLKDQESIRRLYQPELFD